MSFLLDLVKTLSGSDTVIYSGDVITQMGIYLDLKFGFCTHDRDAEDTLKDIENAYGTMYNDTLRGNENDNVLVGQGGDDTLIPMPGGGYDILNGGKGKDLYYLSDTNWYGDNSELCKRQDY